MQSPTHVDFTAVLPLAPEPSTSRNEVKSHTSSPPPTAAAADGAASGGGGGAAKKMMIVSDTFQLSAEYWNAVRNPVPEVVRALNTDENGLTEEAAAHRLTIHGPNRVSTKQKMAILVYLYRSFVTPFNTLLCCLSILTYTAGGDNVGGSIILGMVVLATITTFYQEYKSSTAVEKLEKMVTNTATVLRRQLASDRLKKPLRAIQEMMEMEEKGVDLSGSSDHDNDQSGGDISPRELERRMKKRLETHEDVLRADKDGFVSVKHEVPMDSLVPGDVVSLSAGDMIPADVRLLVSKDLFVSQATLTGESMPVEKRAVPLGNDGSQLFEQSCLCFMGTNVVSGTAKAVVLATGSSTFFGALAKSLEGIRQQTSFDKGINRYVYMMLCFMFGVSLLVFIIIGSKGSGSWMDAFLFAIAIAIGLTPEMLPMIIAVNLAKGALAMARRKAIVKRISAIQNFGAMDVLCTDKTGTLTHGKVILQQYVDPLGKADCQVVLQHAFINSYYQTGLKNMIDEAILLRANTDIMDTAALINECTKVDEIPFDFARRCMSVIVRRGDKHLLVCKGAFEEISRGCSRARVHNQVEEWSPEAREEMNRVATKLNQDGFRVLAVAVRELPLPSNPNYEYSTKDEHDMVLLGACALLDPPRETAKQAIAELYAKGVAVKVLTGDNDLVARQVCKQVGIEADRIVLGSEIDKLDDGQLCALCEEANVFSKLTPANKERIVRALHQNDHVVGFLGDGINDAPALRAADVGISVDNAVDIAKESADIILLEKSLLVLKDGVIKGRKVFGNIIKYIKMGASSNFGNVFSMIGATLLFPFIPMQPVQILLQNLLYDISQTAIPWDTVDSEYTAKPRRWEVGDIAKFMAFLGPTSSVFDYTTWAIIWWYYTLPAGTTSDSSPGAVLFQSIWFVEGLVSQTLVVHVIRTRKVPFIQSRAAWPLIIMTSCVIAVGMALPFMPFAWAFPLTAIPTSFFGFLLAEMIGYLALAHCVKTLFYHIYGVK